MCSNPCTQDPSTSGQVVCLVTTDLRTWPLYNPAKEGLIQHLDRVEQLLKVSTLPKELQEYGAWL